MKTLGKLYLLFFLLFMAGNTSANHLLGGEIGYTFVSSTTTTQTYRVRLSLFGDCGTSSPAAFSALNGATPTIRLYNGNTLISALNLTMVAGESGIDITPLCPDEAGNNKCSNPNSPYPGIKQFVYEGLFTLSGTSSNWKFAFEGSITPATQAGRSNIIGNANILGGSSIMYLYATLNNTGGNNSSPSYTSVPTPFFCINNVQNYNLGAVDPNTDSLVFSLAPAQQLLNVNTPPPGNVTYTAPYTATNPLPVSPGNFSFNSTTGQMTFTANATVNCLVVNAINEYRDGVLVGTSMREMVFVLLNTCTNTPPDDPVTNPENVTVVTNNGQPVFQACLGLNEEMSFDMNPTDADGDNITLTWNNLPAGATASVTNNGTQNPVFHFSWIPTNAAAGNYTFYITYIDDGCPLATTQTIAYTIQIIPMQDPFVTGHTAPCYNMTNGKAWIIPQPNTGVPYDYYWYNNTNSLIDQVSNNIAGDTVTGLTADSYKVKVISPSGCTNTFNIVVTNPNYNADITCPDTTTCPNVPVTMNKNSSVNINTWNWNFGDGSAIVNNQASVSHSYATPGTYIVTLTGYNANNCVDSDKITIIVNPKKTATQNASVCQNDLPYIWNGQNISTGGNTVATYTTPSMVTGCDSTVTLNLTIKPVITATQNLVICQNDMPYTWNGQTINTSGGGIATYSTSSLVSGCDSTTTLNLTVTPVSIATQSITICQNELPYAWNGMNITTGGTNAATYASTSVNSGCDSITTLNLTVIPVSAAAVTHTICQTDLPFLWNGINVNTGGMGAATFTTNSMLTGCDSITTLNLTVLPTLAVNADITICQTALPYSWNGQSISTGGNGIAVFNTPSLATGCDSITTLNLTVNPTINANQNIAICATDLPYTWNGQNITGGGNAIATFGTASLVTGCDSNTILNLTVNPAINATQNLVLCTNDLPYNWNGQTITNGGNNIAQFTTSSLITGCDSTTSLNLVVHPVSNKTIDTTICYGEVYQAGSLLLTQSGTYYDTLQNYLNCDSFLTVHLIVRPAPTTQTATHTGCGFYVLGDSTFTQSVTWTDTLRDYLNCDSIYAVTDIIINELSYNTLIVDICDKESYRFNGNEYFTTGVYNFVSPGANGCDSTSTLLLTVHQLPHVEIQINDVAYYGFCVGDSANLTATGAVTYTWENGYHQWISNGTPIRALLPEFSNIVLVTGTDSNGCVDTATVMIDAEACCTLLMPTAFSPNGDGKNDRFGPVTYTHPVHFQFRIFNRWGQIVFISYKPEDQWDGTYKGQPAEAGVYYYEMTGDCVDGQPLNKKGDLTLVR